jgi:hypothetical protein
MKDDRNLSVSSGPWGCLSPIFLKETIRMEWGRGEEPGFQQACRLARQIRFTIGWTANRKKVLGNQLSEALGLVR